MSLSTVITWSKVTICLFDIHRVQYRNGLKTSMTYLTMVQSSCVVKSGWYSQYFRFQSHQQVNSCDRKAHPSTSSVEFKSVSMSIIGRKVTWTLVCRQSMNSFWRPGVSVINTVSILCYIKVIFSTLKISLNMYVLDYRCYNWCHGRDLVDSSIALSLTFLTLPNVNAFILSELLITLMGFPRLGLAFYTYTAHECTQSPLYDMCQAWYLVPYHRQLDSGGLKV